MLKRCVGAFEHAFEQACTGVPVVDFSSDDK